MKITSIISLIATLLLTAAISYATPTLGVATNMYTYSDTSALTDEYVKHFAVDGIVPAIDPAYHGFVLGPSGSNMTVFTSYDPSVTDIYLMSNTGYDNFPLTFGGQALTSAGTMDKQIDGYNNPSKVYYKLLLPTDISAWTTQVFEESKTFYLYTAPIVYAGAFTPNDHFFSLADTNDVEGAGWGDDFSPKTTSVGGFPAAVPEPSAMMLFGSGLLGLMGFKFGKKS